MIINSRIEETELRSSQETNMIYRKMHLEINKAHNE